MTRRRARVALWWLCAALLLAGLIGTATPVPRAEPAQLEFHGDSVVDVPAPGRYAIWATRPTVAPDAGRCTVPGSTGMSAPRTVVRWVEPATDDTLWTWTATFTATAPGPYRLDCARDPGSPGQRYTVTPEPAGRLYAFLLWQRYRDAAIAVLIAGAGMAIALAARRRPARRDPGGPAAH